jgi:hypothetical protein
LGYILGILLNNINTKAAMGRSKSMNLKEREIHRLKDFPKALSTEGRPGASELKQKDTWI